MVRNVSGTRGLLLLAVGIVMLAPSAAFAQNKLVRMLIDGPILEAPGQEFDLAMLFGGQKSRTLYDWVKAIDKAGKDSEIKGILLILESPQVSFAQIEELTRSLKEFRKTGKKVYCYIDYAGNGAYALATAADHITLAEYSELSIAGFNAQLSFYKGLFDKIGVTADMLHCGDYKSALEPFTRTEPSKPAADNINWLLDGIYGRWVEVMAEGRGLTVEQVKDAVDQAPLSAAKALERKLVDSVSSFPEFKQRIQKEFGKDVVIVKEYPKDKGLELDMSNPFAMFNIFQKMMEESTAEKEAGIGLIYIDGGIVMGKNEPDFMGGGSTAGSTTIRAAIEKAREDDSIKAVVLRVNSPGGSALASDIMWEAATRLAKEKPLIVSMGSVAGSGGYYVSIPGDVIFAEASTITASIGVVGGKLVWKGLMEDKLGITTTEFNRGKNAALMSTNRLWTDEERNRISTWMNEIYDQFKGRIKQSRGDRIKGDLKDLAEGRVFTGRQALERGLIDRIGGVKDAIALAAEKAGLKGDDVEIYVLPKKADFGDVLKRMMGEDVEDEWEVSSLPGFTNDPLLRSALPLLRQFAPQTLRAMITDLRNAAMLNQEHVGLFMPAIEMN